MELALLAGILGMTATQVMLNTTVWILKKRIESLENNVKLLNKIIYDQKIIP